MQDLTTLITDRFDIDRDPARDAAETYLSQIEKEDGRTIDRDAISSDDVEFVIGCVASSVGEVSATPLDRVSAATRRMSEAHAERDAAIRAAADAGSPITQIAEAADLTRQGVYNIINRPQA